MIDFGMKISVTALLSVVISAFIGAIFVSFLGPLLLEKESDEERKEREFLEENIFGKEVVENLRRDEEIVGTTGKVICHNP